MVPGQPDPWATIVTKRAENVELALNGPKGAVQLGQFVELADDAELDTRREDRDTARLRFDSHDTLSASELPEFVRRHLEVSASGAGA
jgi:excinuclease ABC subunit A